MTQIDEFESLFKSADKPVFHFQEIVVRKITIVVDENAPDQAAFVERVMAFLHVLAEAESLEFQIITGDQFSGVRELLSQINDFCADLICTYRNLHIPAEEHPYSLGVYVDVLTQATHTPVLLLPRPDEMNPNTMKNCDRVMAVTDHLAGDEQLITYAARFTEKGGELLLAHIEDESVYKRFIDVIGKIPALDTDVAKEQILAQLLKEPSDYIESCRKEIEESKLPLTITSNISLGEYLADYKRLIEENEVDLLVINTKDDDQLAMHGRGYSLSIEIRDIPLLLV